MTHLTLFRTISKKGTAFTLLRTPYNKEENCTECEIIVLTNIHFLMEGGDISMTPKMSPANICPTFGIGVFGRVCYF